MKKIKLTIEIENEKLNAINLYNKDQENTLDKVLNDTVNSYCEAVVPQEVRFYLDSRKKELMKKQKKRASAEIPKFANQKPENNK